MVATEKAPPRQAGNMPKLGKIGSAGVESARLVIMAQEGFGKTSMTAQAPKPAILMAKGETGFVTLRQKALVPDADAVELTTWDDTLRMVDSLATTDHQTIVLDALGGFERLCFEHVCRRDFDGDWGEKGFASFGRGPDVSVPEWLKLLQRLDTLRISRKVNVVILSHCKVKNFKNPLGPDFDRYIADCHEKVWGVTHKWADAVLFGQFVTVTMEDRKTKRVRGVGGTERVMHTQRTDGYDAKNRYGMAEKVEIGDRDSMWMTVWNAINGSPAVELAPEL